MNNKIFDKINEDIKRRKQELAKEYSTDISKVAHVGNHRYIVITLDGKEITV